MQNKLALLYPFVNAQVISLVIEQAQTFILDYCNLETIPEELNSVLLEMCKQDLNKIGAEGISSENAGGSSLSYEQDYTPIVYKRLKKHKRLKTV